ncbi:MAG: LysR substrate-binding domain-containing protein [Maritimibacter sp.]
MKLSDLPLSGLHAADFVFRYGSLAAAGEALGITSGAVSQRIKSLEIALGAPLFVGSRRGMVPTDLGRAMEGRLRAGFAQIEAAVAEAQRDRRTSLVVSAAPIFAARWLVRRLPRFTARHPDIKVRIEATVELVDPKVSDVDLCLRIGAGPYEDLRAEKLFAHRIMPVCAPQWQKQLLVPEDLRHVPIIRDTHAAYSWDDWLAPLGLRTMTLGPGPEFSDGSLCFDAAMSGAGVFLAWETLDLEAMKDGRMIAPFEFRAKTGQNYWLVSANDRAPSHAQRYFTRWMKEELEADGIELS